MTPPPRPSEFRERLAIQTRWSGNDVYGHINVVYYACFDRATRRPTPIPDRLRTALERLLM